MTIGSLLKRESVGGDDEPVELESDEPERGRSP
jgi:hypothetical protein